MCVINLQTVVGSLDGVTFCGLLCLVNQTLQLNFQSWLASRKKLCFGQNIESDKEAKRQTGSGHTHEFCVPCPPHPLIAHPGPQERKPWGGSRVGQVEGRQHSLSYASEQTGSST